MEYKAEIIFGILTLIYNVVLIISAITGTVFLYKESHSWHSLWLLLTLIALKSSTFIRD